MSDHQPTRACPHRYCSSLHGITAIASLAFFVGAAVSNPVIILGLIGVSLLIGIGVYRMVHKQTMIESIHEEIEGRVRYEARPQWANAAVAVDALLATATVTLFITSAITWDGEAGASQISRTGLLVAILGGAAVTVTDQILHRKAIRVVDAP